MNTRTRNAQRSASGGRFARQLTATRRPTTPARRPLPRPPGRLGRRAPQKSTTDKALEGITGLLNKSNPKRGAGRGGKGKAGAAVLAGVAGLALKNRDKLTSRFGRKPESDQAATPAADAPMAPTSGGEASAPPVP